MTEPYRVNTELFIITCKGDFLDSSDMTNKNTI